MITIPGRIPIHIYPFFWVLIFMIGWMNTLTIAGTCIWACVILISIVIHEYGHALTALAFGQESEISLVGMGGLTQRRGNPISKLQEFFIVLDGPLAGFSLGAVFYLLLEWKEFQNPYLNYALKVGLQVNIFWTILNLFPILPLDGGHLMRIVLEKLFGIRGTKAAFLLSVVLSALFSVFLLVAMQQMIMAALFLMLGFESYRTWSDMRTMTPQDSNHSLQASLKSAVDALNLGMYQDAIDKLIALRNEARSGVIYVTASTYLARVYAQQGDVRKAYELLLPLKDKLSPDMLYFLQTLAYRAQEWKQAIQIGDKAFQNQPSADIALVNALSNAIIGKDQAAIGWLHSAEKAGGTDIDQFVQKREFDIIRNGDSFKKWSQSRRK